MDPAIVKKTQDTLGKVIKKPPLTEKLLGKPPFRFLHDVITEVMKTTGVLKGLYSGDELNSAKVTEKDAKMSFLQKAIDCIVMMSGESLAARPSKIVAGHEPEKTNEFLQLLGSVCLKKLDSSDAVKRVLAGEKPVVKSSSAKNPAKKEDAQIKEGATDSVKKGDGKEGGKPKKDKDSKEQIDTFEDVSREKTRREKVTIENETPETESKEKEARVREKPRDRDRERNDKDKGSSGRDGETKDSRTREDKDRDKKRERDKSRESADKERPKGSEREPKQDKSRDPGEKSKERDPRKPEIAHEDKKDRTKEREGSAGDKEKIKSDRRDDRKRDKDMPGSSKDIKISSSEKDRESSKQERSSKENREASKESPKDVKEAEKNPREKERERSGRSGEERSGKSGEERRTKSKPGDGSKERDSKDGSKLSISNSQDEGVQETDAAPGSSRGDEEEVVLEDGQGNSRSIQRPASAKGQRRRPTKPESEDKDEPLEQDGQGDGSAVSILPSGSTETSQNQSVKRPARPSSARPAPPKVKKQDVIQETPPRVTSGKQMPSVIFDSSKADDDDDETFIVESDSLLNAALQASPSESGSDVNMINTEEHGSLVRKMLESKRDAENLRKGGDPSTADKTTIMDATRRKEREIAQKEIERLRGSIQNLVRSAHPLGKIMDYLQEDIDSMQKELDMWRKENKQHSVAIKAEESVTETEVEPLQAQYAALESEVADMIDKIGATKSNILKNEEQIHELIGSIVR